MKINSFSKRNISIILCIIATILIFANQHLMAMAKDNKKIVKGKRAYEKYCSVCHGETGIGDGSGGVISGIQPSDLTDKAYMSLLSDDELNKIILYGEDALPYLQMPGQGDIIPEPISLDIVYYIRTIAVDKGLLKRPTPKERAEKFKEPMERGKIYYLRYCSPCHGVSGDGKGSAASVLEHKPAVLNDPVLMSKFNEQDILNHVKGLKKKDDRIMPIFGRSITDDMIKVIASHVKTLSTIPANP